MEETDHEDHGSALVPEDFDARVTSIAALAEPVRRNLYRFVVAQPEAVNRDRAAEGVGVARHVAKFHLDRLVDDGLLDFEYRRPPDRRGPGAGRPSKVYRRSRREVTVSLPERHYELPARLLAEAVTRSQDDVESVVGGLRNAAEETGRSLGMKIVERIGHEAGPAELQSAVIAELEDRGYEPRRESDDIIMINCPFHLLAVEFTDLVCGMNLDTIRGLLECLEGVGLDAKLDPIAGQCCVRLQSH